MNFHQLLSNKYACNEARVWAGRFSDPLTAWESCKRADWMLWIAAKLLPREKVVLVTCDCAETALEFVTDTDMQMRIMFTLHITREWCEGREDIDMVRIIRSMMHDVAYAAYDVAYAAANAANAAAYAAATADAATAATTAAATADDASAAAATAAATNEELVANAAANAAAYAAAREQAHINMCNIIRERISFKEISSAANLNAKPEVRNA